MENKNELKGWKRRLYEIIFEADTFAGRLFDIVLLICILLSILVVMLESVEEVRQSFGPLLDGIEWFFTIVFTIEYIARLVVLKEKGRYIFSFFGIVDVLSFVPAYLALFFPPAQALLVIRSVRLLRIFRIFKLARFVGESQNLMAALKASRHKIIVFLITVVTSVIISGTLMYLIEGAENGFTSIPRSIYWAIVTMTTVGYGDIAPATTFGQTVASMIMIMGYGILAVPTGIVSAEMIQQKQRAAITTQVCPHCLSEGHDSDALYCKYCSGKLN
jgi:voltage-gated potassium channel